MNTLTSPTPTQTLSIKTTHGTIQAQLIKENKKTWIVVHPESGKHIKRHKNKHKG